MRFGEKVHGFLNIARGVIHKRHGVQRDRLPTNIGRLLLESERSLKIAKCFDSVSGIGVRVA